MKDYSTAAALLFALNPAVEVYYFTSDGQPFESKQYAENHGDRLKNKAVTPVYHPDIEPGEIKQRERAAAAELKAGQEAAYRSAFPELAARIENNRLNEKRATNKNVPD